MVVSAGGGRLCVPFIIWSLLYSAISLLKDIHHGAVIHWLGYAYRLIAGKSAAPLYYIVVLIQLTVITPWLVKIVKENKRVKNVLWLVTSCYLIYLYIWNFTIGESPYFYEILFPAWFGFYYLGIQVRCGLKFKCNGYMVVIAGLFSCIEAFGLRYLGMSMAFYISQITVGSFLFSTTMIGWLMKRADNPKENIRWLSKVGDCSYGIFYVHMVVIMLTGEMVQSGNWYIYWSSRFILTAMVSFIVVLAVQKLLKNRKKLLTYIGFI